MTANKNFYRASAVDFGKIPGSPIAYWVRGTDLFTQAKIGDVFVSGGRNKTHDNELYLRYFWEINKKNANWVSYANGGDFRKYAGNELNVVDWSIKARDNYEAQGGLCNPKYWNKEGITWCLITSSNSSFRIKPTYSQYSSGSPTIFNMSFVCDNKVLAFLNSPIARYYLKAINPTINTTVNDIFALPLLKLINSQSVNINTNELISLSKSDWNSYETSWDFTSFPLISTKTPDDSLFSAYTALRQNWQSTTHETQRLETENNRIFITAYGLESELTPEVPLKEITLTCNPHYRYGIEECEVGSEKWEAMESRLLQDTMKEFISYAVGCMFGRYSLDKPGLILANAGETITDYLSQIPNPTFMPDTDNVIPLMSMDWFTDDLAERFKEFLKITFGTENFDTNLQFIEKALGKNGKPLTIREYFLKDFYNDHVRRYKKRPIYWLFSSPKGSFNALIYMHRYRSDTVSSILNGYLREFRTKLTATKNHLEAVSISTAASAGEKTKALKDIENIRKIIEEIDVYERDILYPLATKQIEIDLDDGVKVNYQKFGTAVKKIVGLDSKEED